MSITLKKVNGDIFISDSNGRPYYIEKTEKLAQDIADALMTTYSPSRGWGSELSELVGKIISPSTLKPIGEAFIQKSVNDAIDRLIQKQQERSDQLDEYEIIDDFEVQIFKISNTSYTFMLEITPLTGPNKSPLSFQIQLGHQLLNTAKINLPGMSNL